MHVALKIECCCLVAVRVNGLRQLPCCFSIDQAVCDTQGTWRAGSEEAT